MGTLLNRAARASAARMRRSPALAEALRALERRAKRIVALGDSLTADPRSWAEILRNALRVELINLGVPGDTTVHLVGRFSDVADCRPDLVIVLAGTNDARRHGAAAGRMLVPHEQTKHNLELLDTLVREQTAASAVFVTPPPVIAERIRRAPALRREGVTWRESDVAEKAAIVRSLDAEVIDSRQALRPADGRALLADGLHLNASGQERLARLIVRALVG